MAKIVQILWVKRTEKYMFCILNPKLGVIFASVKTATNRHINQVQEQFVHRYVLYFTQGFEVLLTDVQTQISLQNKKTIIKDKKWTSFQLYQCVTHYRHNNQTTQLKVGSSTRITQVHIVSEHGQTINRPKIWAKQRSCLLHK